MKNNTAGSYILEELRKKYEVTEENIGADAHMNKGPMHFHVRSFEIEDFGHLCLFDLNGMFGLMKMETVVIQCRTKDVPLVNFDTIIVPGKKTQMAEFYDTKVYAFAENLNDECMKIKEADSDLQDYEAGEHWYDSILYPCSYAKVTKKNDMRTEESCRKYFDAFLKASETAPACDPAEKVKANKAFAAGLLEHGGPAVDQVRKMFGEERTQRLILEYMYGVEES